MCLTLQRPSRCARMLPDPLAAIIPPLGLQAIRQKDSISLMVS
jgi:hypothetical protein